MRVLVVDDHAPTRKTLRQLLELREEFEVVGEGSNGLEAIDRCDELKPDIVLMDMNMPGMNGVDATRAIREQFPRVKVLALTALADMALVTGMVKAGASGYLLKGGPPNELLESLQAVHTGHGVLDREVTANVMDDMAELYKKEQERADALEELDRMKSEFVSVVSHELRTPLTAIKGSSQTLQKSWQKLDDGSRETFLNAIDQQCDRLNRAVSQLLTVSGIQRGGLGLHPVDFPLAEVARMALEVLQRKLSGRRLALSVAEVGASGDRDRITEVAVSLIENALAFTEGEIRVAVAERDDRVVLAVADDGPGIEADRLAALLEGPFQQGDSSSTRAIGGMGLSLYIATQVLEASGGSLEIDTSPDSGSTFTMVLKPAADPT